VFIDNRMCRAAPKPLLVVSVPAQQAYGMQAIYVIM